ncbi:hypothetical protein Tco_1562365 [Tanacetum coccineum]
MKVDGRTKNVLFYSWMNGNWNKRRINDNILNNNEWKKFDYGNPLNTATNLFFKAHDERDVEEWNELRQMKRKGDNKNDEQPNKRFILVYVLLYATYHSTGSSDMEQVIQMPGWLFI